MLTTLHQHPTRLTLPPYPVLLLTAPTAPLCGDWRGVRTVAAAVYALMDGAANMTEGDRELVRRLYEIACEDA